jgi:hypothetical protein
MRLGMKIRREIVEAHYWRYQRAGKKEKGKILEEVAGTTGLNRDHLAHVLASYGKKQGVKKERQADTGEARRARRKREQGTHGGRPPKYHQGFVVLLTRVWEDYGQPCGKPPAPLIRGIIDFLAASREPDYGISEETQGLLVKVSRAQIDRLLAPARGDTGDKRDPCGGGFSAVPGAGSDTL